MTLEEYKEALADEWAFWKRNPEIPFLYLLFIIGNLYVIFSD